jgi:hypothetical protein
VRRHCVHEHPVYGEGAALHPLPAAEKEHPLCGHAVRQGVPKGPVPAGQRRPQLHSPPLSGDVSLPFFGTRPPTMVFLLSAPFLVVVQFVKESPKALFQQVSAGLVLPFSWRFLIWCKVSQAFATLLFSFVSLKKVSGLIPFLCTCFPPRNLQRPCSSRSGPPVGPQFLSPVLWCKATHGFVRSLPPS